MKIFLKLRKHAFFTVAHILRGVVMIMFSCKIMPYFPSDPCSSISNGNRISSGLRILALIGPCILHESEAWFGKNILKSGKICDSEEESDKISKIFFSTLFPNECQLSWGRNSKWPVSPRLRNCIKF